MIYADFENISAPENNGKQSPESYASKYQTMLLIVTVINCYNVMMIN